MRPFEASTTIDASPEEVWAVLADSAGWSAWDSGVDGVDGKLAPDQQVTIRSAVAPGRAFPVRVTRFEPGACLELTGGLPLGLFRGVRTYRLQREGPATGFTMREEYGGPLTGLVGRSIPDLQPSFDQFVRGLKQRVERGR
jgi:uncharacterized protein YndB with AHSA1/START domain